MKIEDIKQLVELMVANDLSELNVTDGDTKISLKRGAGEAPGITTVSLPVGAPAEAPPQAEPAEELIEIRSPMVGTFYPAPSPDSEPFVACGDSVDTEAVVCIIEAMKVMNEIKADCDGTIVEICVKNIQPVEFGQVLFRVRPR